MKNKITGLAKWHAIIKHRFNGKKSIVGAKNKKELDQLLGFIKRVNKDAVGNKNKYLNIEVTIMKKK